MYTIPYRHIHLDFHTSGLIEGIGKDFSPKEFQRALQDGCVDSITLCAKCHHGWMYYPSKRFPMHPHLSFDLFGQMLAAAREIGVTVEAYVSVGYDEKIALEHSDWLMRKADQSLDTTPDFLSAGYHQFCMNSPYLDMVCMQIEDLLSSYEVDGIFLDIVGERECYCANCMGEARNLGLDIHDPASMRQLWRRTYATYVQAIADVVARVQPGIEIFHNSGHVNRGRMDLVEVNSHLELESLPTGGWGYDHFLLSSRFVQPLGKPFLGMTGRFQYGWGDFGGYKHPNGLRYETSRFLANGAGCSIGDQMHPFGALDPGLYRMIGTVYREVKAKQPWCTDVVPVAEIGVLSTEAAGDYAVQGAGDSLQQGSSDIGAVRILEESHLLFDVLGPESDFSSYRLIILPDRIKGDGALQQKLDDYLVGGGKVLATGRSGLGVDGGILLDRRLCWKQKDPYRPNYVHPAFSLDPLESDSFVMYYGSQTVVCDEGLQVLARVQEPFFNRSVEHFSSHYHTPCSLVDGDAGIVASDSFVYCVWNLFAEYAQKGNLAAKYLVVKLLERLLSGRIVDCAYPAQVELSLMDQRSSSRLVLHVIGGSLVRHGVGMEVVEDFLPVPDGEVTLHVGRTIRSVYLAPGHTDIPFSTAEGTVTFSIPSFVCHRMVVLDYERPDEK